MLPHPLTKRERLSDPALAAGQRAYLIGQQDGSFSALGDHITGEMGGLWAHPYKMLDGIWLGLLPFPMPPLLNTIEWLPAATTFVNLGWGIRHEHHVAGVVFQRTCWVPDDLPALVVDLVMTEVTGKTRDITLCVLARPHLRPGWPDSALATPEIVAEHAGCIVASRVDALWSVAWGCDHPPTHVRLLTPDPSAHPLRTRTSGLHCVALRIPAGGTARLRVAVHGSDLGPAVALADVSALLTGADWRCNSKQQRLANWLETAHLTVPDPLLHAVWPWTALTYDWMERCVPSVGHGLGAGLPEYPWWFGCDSSYALRGLLPLGRHDLVRATLDLLATASRRANGESGRIIHEMSTTGHVYNPGNVQETPQFACAVVEACFWSGDRTLLDDLYPLCRAGVLEWVLGTRDSDGDLLPEGYGIVEIEGLDHEMIDSAVWTYAGLRAVGYMATLLGDSATAQRCLGLAERARATIDDRFWLPSDHLYADWIATPVQAQRQIAAMLERARQVTDHPYYTGGADWIAALEDMRAGAEAADSTAEMPWLMGNWIINAPLEQGMSTVERARLAFARLDSAAFLGDDGVYLCGPEQGRAMSISTAAYAAACCAYGRIDRAIALARLLAEQATLRYPGAISEVAPADGCFVQAWSAYGIVYPLVSGVCGLYPNAIERLLVCAPQLPIAWPSARLERLAVGDAWLTIDLCRVDGGIRCRLEIDQEGWQVLVVPPTHLPDLLPITPMQLYCAPRHGEPPEAPAGLHWQSWPDGHLLEVILATAAEVEQ